jgi:DNA-binding transcriptional LysR family regulator
MNYTLHQLQIFVKVVETKSVTKASEALYLTQPAVSIQLKKLQEQFEVPLFEVVGRRLYITDFGNEIARTAEKILEQVYAINYRTMAYKGQLAGRLRFSVVSTGKYVMPYFLTGFVRRHPDVEFSMDVTNKTKVLESLEQNEVDFSLVSVIPAHLNLERIDLLSNRLFLVGSGSSDLAEKIQPGAILENLPLIYREEGSGTRQTMEAFLRSNGFATRKKLELTSNEAVKQALIAGLGYSIMPLIGIKNELKNGSLRIIRTTGLPIETKWSLIWLQSKQHSPLAQAFHDYIEEHRTRIVDEQFSWAEEF